MSHQSLPSPAPPGRDLVALLDTYGVIRYLSGPVEESLGVAPDDRVGTSLMALVHPDDRPRVARTFGTLRETPGSGSAFECRCRHRDGTWRHFRAALEHLPQGLGPARVVLTAQDVSEERPQGERLRLLESVAVHANDAILITQAEPIDGDGPCILYANPAFLRTTGYTLDEVLGKTPRILQGPDTAREPRDKIRKALKRWRPIVVELLNYRKDGTTFWVELSIVPVADATGYYTHWVSIQRDITDRRRAVEALQAAKDEAEAANHAKSEFLSRMSHELRTPLNAIMGFAQILQLDPAAAPHRPVVDDMFAAGKRLLALINEVLDIARVEAGGVSLSLESVSLVDVVRESLSLLAPLAAKRNIRLDCDPPAVPPVCVMADRQRLGQVLLNLLSNAVKYSRPGDSVGVSGSVAGARVRVRVADTGPGLPPDKMARLFTPFDRLGAEATGVEGTGLGLSLSKRLVEAMGGAMGAECAPGDGCTFWFELPAAAPPAESPPPPAESELAAAPPGSHLVLYVEDNPANVRVVEMALAHRPGVRLMSALQGGLGADLAAQHRPDLVLLDLHLPDLGGEEVLRRLRDDPNTRATPVVVLSADATPRQVARLRAAGASDYLTKPLDLRDLLRVVDAALGGDRPARHRLTQGIAPRPTRPSRPPSPRGCWSSTTSRPTSACSCSRCGWPATTTSTARPTRARRCRCSRPCGPTWCCST